MITKNKYIVSLSQEHALKLKKLLSDIGMPRGQFSTLLDEHVRTLIPIFEHIKEKRRRDEPLEFAELIGVVDKSAKSEYQEEENDS